jgi:hypothetical protein
MAFDFQPQYLVVLLLFFKKLISIIKGMKIMQIKHYFKIFLNTILVPAMRLWLAASEDRSDVLPREASTPGLAQSKEE